MFSTLYCSADLSSGDGAGDRDSFRSLPARPRAVLLQKVNSCSFHFIAVRVS